MPEDGLNAVQHALLNQGLGTPAISSARLKNGPHSPVPLASMVPQQLHCAQQHGHMGVVPAGVHHAIGLTAERQPLRLPNGQRVDVRPQGHKRAVACLSLQVGHQSGRLCPAEGNPPFRQGVC